MDLALQYRACTNGQVNKESFSPIRVVAIIIPVVDERIGGGASVAEREQVLIVVERLGLHHHGGQLHILLEASRYLGRTIL